MDEMDEIDDPLFFRQVKMKVHYWNISIRKYLKLKIEKIEELKISIEQMLLT
jgi:hypothetical protein